MTENWRPVVGWEGLYEVSDLGRVKSLARVIRDSIGRSKPIPERLLSDKVFANGYPVIQLARGGTTERRYVHQLVMRAFVGPVPAGHEIAHGNGDSRDARLVNLRYATPRENHADKRVHGTVPLGVAHYGHRLCDEQVLDVDRQIAAGRSLFHIARDYGVSFGCIRGIAEGRSWAWLTGRERVSA